MILSMDLKTYHNLDNYTTSDVPNIVYPVGIKYHWNGKPFILTETIFESNARVLRNCQINNATKKGLVSQLNNLIENNILFDNYVVLECLFISDNEDKPWFFADYYFPYLNLVVELDDIHHDYNERKYYDEIRDNYLTSININIERVNLRRLSYNLDKLKDKLLDILSKYPKITPIIIDYTSSHFNKNCLLLDEIQHIYLDQLEAISVIMEDNVVKGTRIEICKLLGLLPGSASRSLESIIHTFKRYFNIEFEIQVPKINRHKVISIEEALPILDNYFGDNLISETFLNKGKLEREIKRVDIFSIFGYSSGSGYGYIIDNLINRLKKFGIILVIRQHTKLSSSREAIKFASQHRGIILSRLLSIDLQDRTNNDDEITIKVSSTDLYSLLNIKSKSINSFIEDIKRMFNINLVIMTKDENKRYQLSKNNNWLDLFNYFNLEFNFSDIPRTIHISKEDEKYINSNFNIKLKSIDNTMKLLFNIKVKYDAE